ncbi:Luciferase-like monooxygenase [Nostocoides japonicum T1-X7]|uniref:Luciferase-like monooxygenase n=1 Tax=Nostocoides japonicum T1-X7 TaxID=1194083 RepID=A0A077LWC1_9MICO|nr:LLM class flavin-dependent oxidoreductase [Tetrasphaera japonica]CCH76210.1 Luciferase-like monooxygenase [Tetrasphaera japonica T1-X7]
MRYGFVVPFASERQFVELARLGEARGWDAVFSWEAVHGPDAWVTLGAAAVETSRIRLGTLLTPVPRYRPWDLAGRVATVDRLSEGRVVLGAGLGAVNGNWLAFAPDEGRAVRAAQLDEGLEVYAGLLAGQPYEHEGRFWTVRPVTELVPPPPVQRPHPPVWVVGMLVRGRSRQPSLDRAARWQGIFPAVSGGPEGSSGLTRDGLGEIVEHLRRVRSDLGLPWESYDVVIEGDSHGGFGDIHGPASEWADLGATWWVESWWDLPGGEEGVAELFRRVDLGPVR